MSRIAIGRSPLRTAARLAIALGLVLATLAPATVAAADGSLPTIEARVLLEGHARLGSWIAIEVRLTNDGPAIIGELRLQGGAQNGTRFSLPVDLPTTSDKTFILYAQPPSFGQQLEVVLVRDEVAVVRHKVAFSLHDANQLVVGVIAAQSQNIVGSLTLPAAQNERAAVVVPLDPGDLPDRIEAWSTMDRLIWQDVDTTTLTADQLRAMRGWLALGGRLIVVAGTTGPGVLAGLPDDLLPYRPDATIDVAPESLESLIGVLPDDATDLPALGGELIRGRTLASSGDRVIAAETAYGAGAVSVIGVDPTVGWLVASRSTEAIWRTTIPPRSGTTASPTDDNTLVSAVSELPALSLPPTGGLLLLLVGYIVLIGPVNYLVLRRLDRREWAWVTMPVLIAVFAAGSYGFGSALRGSDVILNEVAIVRGAPDATEGSAQAYLGVFSPARGSYQLTAPDGALLSSPLTGDFFGGQGLTLDVLQGRPSRVRNLAIGFGSLRTIRAETQATVPLVHAELELVDGVLKGTVRNDSETQLEDVAVVLGSMAATLDNLAPGQSAPVELQIRTNEFQPSLSDRLFGQALFGERTGTTEEQRRDATRRRVIDYLTYDPTGLTQGRVGSDGPVVLAWARGGVLDVAIEGQAPARVSNVLYFLPAAMPIRGETAFRRDLMRNAVTESDAAVFNKGPLDLSFGQGSVTMAYRPIGFQGTFEASRIVFAVGYGQILNEAVAERIEPLPAICAIPADDRTGLVTDPCPPPRDPAMWDGMPEVEVFDRTGEGRWLRLPRLVQSSSYELADAARYVDPATGTVLVRFVNETQNQAGFGFDLGVDGTIR